MTGPDAEDLVAQSLEVAWRRIDDVPADDPMPWLYAVARNLWRNHRRPLGVTNQAVRALAGRPALVMADEPTGNLDTATGASILELLRELHRDGTTIVVITHDRDVAAVMDRHVEIRDGRIIRDSPTGA